MTDEIEIEIADESCPYCDHSPFHIYHFVSHNIEKWYCESCSRQLYIEDLPPTVHENWMVVVR